MKYNTARLDNGLRIIHLPSTSPVVYCGYEINAGTSNEGKNEEGIAHFCEHVSFKGTQRRDSLDIINCLEDVGGDLNAYTTKVTTVYYSAILKEHFLLAADLLSDIVFHSTYPQSEIDKEVEVICDEIESYNDSPAELIYDEFENIVFRNHPLGHSILGTTRNVRSFTTEDARRFTDKFYRPDNCVFYIYGDIAFDEAVAALRNYTADVQRMASEAQPVIEDGTAAVDTNRYHYRASNITVHKKTHQAHVMIGNRAYNVHDKRRLVLYLLNNILGGPGMNARLNLSLREQNGLVYTVESFMTAFSAVGLWGIYFGCDPKDVRLCTQLVRKELDRFMNVPLTPDELAAAKRQIKGQLGIASDNKENFALGFGLSYLHYGWEKHTEKLYQQIDSITVEELQAVASDLFQPETLTTLIYK